MPPHGMSFDGDARHHRPRGVPHNSGQGAREPDPLTCQGVTCRGESSLKPNHEKHEKHQHDSRVNSSGIRDQASGIRDQGSGIRDPRTRDRDWEVCRDDPSNLPVVERAASGRRRGVCAAAGRRSARDRSACPNAAGGGRAARAGDHGPSDRLLRRTSDAAEGRERLRCRRGRRRHGGARRARDERHRRQRLRRPSTTRRAAK